MSFISVESLKQGVDALESLGESAQILAGGTDVMIQIERDEIKPSTLLHIGRLAELTKFYNDKNLKIGALVSHSKLAESMSSLGYPSIAEAAATVGGWQTQSIGTIGGNVCNASPAADVVPPLLVHDSTITLVSANGKREIALDDFILGRRVTARRPDEILTNLTLVQAGKKSGDVYLKVGRRSAMEIAIVGIAVRLDFDVKGVVERARIALASVGPRSMRVRQAEEVLEGIKPDREVLDESAARILDAVSPIDDLRGSEGYRRKVIPRLLRRAVEMCGERAGTVLSIKGA